MSCCHVSVKRFCIFFRVFSTNSANGTCNWAVSGLPNITSTGRLGVQPNKSENGVNWVDSCTAVQYAKALEEYGHPCVSSTLANISSNVQLRCLQPNFNFTNR